MALPSTRRPVVIEEDLEVNATKAQKIKVDVVKIFMGTMIEWYEQMSDKTARKLTTSKLKRKAVSVLFSYKYEYDRLPRDWVLQLIEKTGMKLYQRKKKTTDFSFMKDKGV